MLKYLTRVEPELKKSKIYTPIAATLTTKCKMTKKTQNVNIPTTDLASLCGMDHYNNWNKSICRIWKQLYPNDYKQTETNVRSKGDFCAMDSNMKKMQTLQSKTASNINTTHAVQMFNQKRHTSSSTLVKGQNDMKKEIMSCDKMTEEQKAHMITLMNSATNVVYGTRNEGRGIDAFTNITGKKIKSSQNKLVFQFATSNLANGNTVHWNITGKYDGLTDANEIVEIKNRQKRLFYEIRDYEMCQLQTYLHILNSNTAYLVEVLGGKTDNEISILETQRDNEYFTNVLKTHLDNVRNFSLNIPYMEIEDKYKLMAGTHKFGF